MIVTISTTHSPATDLGHLLRKHPDRVQEFSLASGTAHVFYPEATEERCTAALLLEVDPAALARTSRRSAPADFMLGQYVNDRPYAVSSLVAVALKRVFSTAFTGQLESNQALADSRIPLEIRLPAVPCVGGAERVEEFFAPLGWTVVARNLPLDPEFPQWGDSRYVDLHLTGDFRVADALRHLYVLLPAMDPARHYWVGEDDVAKLKRHGAGWLSTHPAREAITAGYLIHQGSLVHEARDRLLEIGDQATDGAADAAPLGASDSHQHLRQPLREARRAAVLGAFRDLGAASVADIGCGEGHLLAALLDDARFTRVVGADVSTSELARAEKRLRLDRRSERERQRVTLIQSSATYRDARLAGFDAIVLMEVIEHVDAERLGALERAVFAHARPRHVLVTTPNAEYNALYEGLDEGSMRHHDHRWEATRAEFTAWSDRVAQAHGYVVTHQGIGPDDATHGAAGQMAIFSREADS
ncbi:MAG: 3' terminal RNA ribose 2'-O-methyltransferase Hen1 [Demequina sp.]|uniref:3' terminal RNA ribose 2'-O-methyltransferase Hen1 n=1 Tax=Demequina sp. TaxID=2050685 RepID=UPI003A878C5B